MEHYKDRLKADIMRLLERLQQRKQLLEEQDEECRRLFLDAQSVDDEEDYVRKLEILRNRLRQSEFALTEGQVEHALRLFMGRQLVDGLGWDQEKAMMYVMDHEPDLLTHLADAVEEFVSLNGEEDEDEEDEDEEEDD
jgi:hypothetical protein